MCNHYKKLLMLIAVASLALAGCGSNNKAAPVAPGVDSPAGITVVPLDDNDLTTLPAVFALPAAINDNNQIVGSAEVVGGGTLKPAFWQVNDTGAATVAPTVMATINDGFAAAADINSDGVIVGMAANADASIRAVVWTDKDASPTFLPGLPLGAFAAAYGINDSGRIVGTAENSDGLRQAVRWQRNLDGTLTGGLVVLPGVPAGWEAEAYAVNADNHIVGELIDTEGVSQAVLWKLVGDAYVRLDLTAPAGFMHAVAIDLSSPAAGEPLVVVGEVADDGLDGLTQAVRWSVSDTAVTVTNLGSADRSSSAVAVNNTGRAAGWENNTAAVTLATVWNSPAGKNALLTTESQSFDINNSNLVVGRSAGQGFVKQAN